MTSATGIERDIENLRADLTVLTHELGQRERELFDWKLQLRRHALAIGIILGVTTAAMAGTIYLSRRRTRR